MTLIKSISGIRGTIGGKPGNNLTPVDVVQCTAAFATWVLEQNTNNRIVLGQDARISGNMIRTLCAQTLLGMGMEVFDLGFTTTPTTEMEVIYQKAAGGIILTASHNPIEWNALKLLNEKGEFISAKDGQSIVELIEMNDFNFAEVHKLGKIHEVSGSIERHIQSILNLPWVNMDAIRSKKFTAVVDYINSTGVISIKPLLEQLGVEVIDLYGDNSGNFAHNPEPLENNLQQLAQEVLNHKADIGIAVDPDVDRLVLIDELGNMFGEEYSLVAIADYILSKKSGAAVSNLSSSRALKDICQKHNCQYFASAVGEINVVEKMKEVGAVIGGEGNGGIILPDLHYGRDAMVGIALFLSHLTEKGCTVSALRKKYPFYSMVKEKMNLSETSSFESILPEISKRYQAEHISTVDGLKIDFPDAWIHLRKSNTEPIVRLYGEGETNEIINARISELKSYLRSLDLN